MAELRMRPSTSGSTGWRLASESPQSPETKRPSQSKYWR